VVKDYQCGILAAKNNVCHGYKSWTPDKSILEAYSLFNLSWQGCKLSGLYTMQRCIKKQLPDRASNDCPTVGKSKSAIEAALYSLKSC
jgi:hypothetical protein